MKRKDEMNLFFFWVKTAKREKKEKKKNNKHQSAPTIE